MKYIITGTTNPPEAATFRGVLVISGFPAADTGRQAAAALLVSVQPFADVVGDDTRRDGDQKCDNDVHSRSTPFPAERVLSGHIIAYPTGVYNTLSVSAVSSS